MSRFPRRRPKGRVPLERALSKLGLASRTEARKWIEEGCVKVHGTLERDPLREINPDSAHIEILGRKARKEDPRLLILHKPGGVVTTKRDPEGRRTVYDLLPPDLQRFHAVGRLDMHTTGLLLMTNDTRLSSHLTDPENRIPRTYVVSVRGEVLPEELRRMESGVEDAGELLSVACAEVQKSSGRESRLLLELHEGKNREIRRLCKALGHEVTALKRIRFGAWTLGTLLPGEWRESPIPQSLLDASRP
jgi:23S rRNA pseudouridine2605 synthase